MHKLAIYLILFYTPNVLASLKAIRSDKSLYDFGVFGGAGYIPDYPASNQGRIRSIAAPIIRYRGLRFRSDEEDSMKARLLSDPLYGVDVSASGSFPANSSDNDARKGMPDLDWMAEIGPRFYTYLIKTEKTWLRFFLPIRMAYSTDIKSVTYQGMVFAPSINLRHFFSDNKFNSIILAISRNYTSRGIQEYYFEVDKKFAIPGRPEYQAGSGYLSTSLGLAYFFEKNNKGIFTGIGVNSYKGSANAGSPLHKVDYNYGVFLGFSYTFFQSEERGFQ